MHQSKSQEASKRPQVDLRRPVARPAGTTAKGDGFAGGTTTRAGEDVMNLCSKTPLVGLGSLSKSRVCLGPFFCSTQNERYMIYPPKGHQKLCDFCLDCTWNCCDIVL